MTEDDRRHSSSRREATASPPSAGPPEAITAEAAAAPRRRLPARLRKRSALAGAAVSLVAVGGLGGFALGQEVGQNGTTPAGVVQGGTPAGGQGPFGGGQSDSSRDGSGQDSGQDADDGGSGGDSGDDA